MTKLFFKTTGLLLGFVLVLNLFAYVYANEKSVQITGKFYQFVDSKNKYEFSSANPITNNVKNNPIGKLSITGKITEDANEKADIPTFIVEDSTLISINYSYSDDLLNADKANWHLNSDSCKTIDGIELENKIKNGAILLQTSRDGKKWVTISEKTDFIQSGGTEVFSAENNTINNIQLLNGCYYRIIAAYQTAKTDKGYFNPLKLYENKPTTTEYQRNLELYEFYASYKKREKSRDNKNYHIYKSSTEEYTVKTKKNDYSGSEKVDLKDPHNGLELGYFSISGYSSVNEKNNEYIFLKNSGDEIKLIFHLQQDIDQLGGNSSIFIADDKKGYDSNFEYKPHNMGRGELIVKHTTPEGETKKTAYSNFLEALASPGADTEIGLFEEGTYEVHLCYAITNKDGIDRTTYYKTAFEFEIGSGNSMAYIFDVKTKTQLSSGDITENGFFIDDAKSKSIDFIVKKEVLNDGADGLTEDVRFNQVAASGKEYTDEGIYTITAINKHIDLKTDIKIYVGNNNILKAYIKNPDKYTIEQLKNMSAKGEITENGNIVISEISEETSAEIYSEMNIPNETTTVMQNTDTEKTDTGVIEETFGKQRNLHIPIIAVIIIVVLFVGIGMANIKKR